MFEIYDIEIWAKSQSIFQPNHNPFNDLTLDDSINNSFDC